MSYILDALKQSEGRRKQEAPSDMPPAQAFATHSLAPRRGGRLPLAAALLLAIALVSWWTLDSADSPPTAAVPGEAGNSRSAGPGGEVSNVAEATEVQASAAPSTGVAEMIVAAIGDEDLRGVRILLDVPPTPRPTAGGRDGVESETKTVQSNTGSVPGTTVMSTSQDNSDAHAGLPYRRQLPVDVQRSLPELTFSVHIYSADPASRRVKIGERMMREGQRITPQLRLEEIIPKGVILSYEDYRFRMNAL